MPDEMSIGEVGRLLNRMDEAAAAYRMGHHAQINEVTAVLGRLSDKIDKYIGPVAVLQKQADTTELVLPQIVARVDALEKKAAQVWAVGSLLGAAAGYLSGWLHR